MDDVKRYNLRYGAMHESMRGHYVKHADYAARLAEVEEERNVQNDLRATAESAADGWRARAERAEAALATAVEALQIIASHPNSDELYNDAAFEVEEHACDFDEHIFLARAAIATLTTGDKTDG